MPRARVSRAPAVKPRARRSTRTPWRRSRAVSSRSARFFMRLPDSWVVHPTTASELDGRHAEKVERERSRIRPDQLFFAFPGTRRSTAGRLDSPFPRDRQELPMTPDDFFKLAKKHEAEMLDLKFVDMLGSWQHCSFPIDTLDEGTFQEGLGFDGSSIRGWMGIHESDMMAVPDPDTARLDPFFTKPTLSIIANVIDPLSRKPFTRDPRHIAQKAEAYLKQTGIADTCYVGPEPEFFIFDEVRYEQNQHRGYYQIDSVEGAWNTGRIEEPNLGYKPSFKGGYFPGSPADTFHDLRGEMVYEMRKVGIIVE